MLKKFQTIAPKVEDVAEIIREESYIFVEGKLIAVYKKADYNLDPIRNACLNLEFPVYTRQSGLITQTINVNASPRNGLRTNKCMFTKFRKELPTTHSIFLTYARKLAKSYRENFRVAYANQIKQSHVGATSVNKAYRISGTPFTSAVINKNTPLGYHKDRANTLDGISCMLTLTKGLGGGELILPELNIGFACQDGYVLLFDGQKYIHGVAKIHYPQTGKGYRYTIVYYNNKGMSLCLAPVEEEKLYKDYLEKHSELSFKKAQNKNER